MTGPIVIELSGEPKGKARPRFVRATGAAFTPAETRRYESALRFAGQEAMGSRPPADGALVVSVLAVFPIPASWSRKKRADATDGQVRPTTRPDADNLLKMLDGLNEVVWRDDRQIVDARVTKRYGERPMLRIVVEAA